MIVRIATPDDLPAFEALWHELRAEVPPPAHEEADVPAELAEIRALVESGLGWAAERDGDVVGMVLGRRRGPRVGRITDLYVRPGARRQGVAEALARAVVARFAEDGVDTVDLEVMASNTAARAAYARWGFRDEVLVLAAPVAALADRLGEVVAAASFGSIHAQTDDVDVILKAVEMLVPRLPGRSAGSLVTQPRAGYVTVYDDVCDRDPAMLRRLAKEISSRTGLVVITLGVEVEAVVRMILFDRGGIVDEYASLPEFHGPSTAGRDRGVAREPRRGRALHGRVAGVDSRRRSRGGRSVRPAPRRGSCSQVWPAPWGCPASSTVGPTRPRTMPRSGSTVDADAGRRPPLPVLCPRSNRSRGERARARNGRHRPRRPTAWLYEMNPVGRVPVIEHDGWVLPESAVINEYLEDRFPESPLLPADPEGRAVARLRILRDEDFTRPYYALRRGQEGAEAALAEALGSLDATLAGTPYLTGSTFGLADVAYVPWVIRARDLLGVSLTPYRRAEAWLASLEERPSVAAEIAVVSALAPSR